jgi:hypothetical protein
VIGQIHPVKADGLEGGGGHGETTAAGSLQPEGSSNWRVKGGCRAALRGPGATMVASDSIMKFGVCSASFPQRIFSFGTAPE